MSDKVAIITGGGSGIGSSVAQALVKQGYSVALAGRRPEMLEKTAQAIQHHSRVLLVPTDVGDSKAVEHLFSKTVEKYGRVDLLFNNAGTNTLNSILLEDLTDEDWQRVVDVNLTGAFFCIREAFRVMKNQLPMGGRIINNGSISSQVPRPNSAPYNATKHAITGLTKSASLDGRKYNIACGQIDIGNAYTPMASKMQKGVPQADGSIAIEPTMDVDNVVQAVLYMASLPPEANVLHLTVMATKMPFVGRG
jgi:NAD(P)-dependent dehydrogenase (short-subunit alcohol dehydrogenase family)